MVYYAHITDDDRKQTVEDHAKGVSGLAELYSIDMLKPLAAATGLAHDIGKYSEVFQERLNGSSIRYEHSICGAIEYDKIAKSQIEKIIFPMIEYCIAGHHTGLPDGGQRADKIDDETLYGRMARRDQYKDKLDYSAYQNYIELSLPKVDKLFEEIIKFQNKTDMIEKYAFFTRYLFSCLTDADYLDTEHFCKPEINRELNADFDSVENALNDKFSSFIADTPLKSARSRLQNQAYSNCEEQSDSNISILNMPTGSGKTLCSLKIALQKLRASKGSKKRIIYVIPYTSIIEQTASQFEEIFGQYADILQHHSNYCFDDETDMTTMEKLKKATENWDVPFVITTSVQFFQSLYHYKSSGLRKLHNIGDSIIIFDEIHMLPAEMLQPCLRGIGYITKYLNSEAIFLSATMPDYSMFFNTYLSNCNITELIKDKSDFDYFRKCTYINLGKTDFDNILEKADKYTSSLIIVNSRKSAREVYKSVSGKKYHLSTYMTPNDRSRIIEEIKTDLENNVKITVVSTSLVEAGVDFDFEVVFRQIAGFDSILQSGGRCNREGKRQNGDVFVFETDEALYGDMKVRANIARSLMNEYDDITLPQCIEDYYNRLFDFNENIIERNSIAVDCTGIDNIPFRSYAKNFEFIKDDTIGVVIDNCDETAKCIEKLKNGDYSVKRKLQKYTVALKFYSEFQYAFSLGIVDDFGKGVYILTNPEYYNKEIGLNLNMSCDVVHS